MSGSGHFTGLCPERGGRITCRGYAAPEHAAEPVIHNLPIEPGVAPRHFGAQKNVRAIGQFVRGEKYACNREIRRRLSDDGLSCVGLMTEITDRRDGKRSRLQNQCPVSDIIDLRQLICAVSAASLLQSGYPGHDVEMRERTTK
jgi:hypothetical protein